MRAPMVQDPMPDGAMLEHEENLWSALGDIPRLEMPLKRRMVVARREDGTLVIHSAVLLPEAEMAELEALGRPSILIVPNGHHRLDAPAFKARYPELRVFCPARVAKKVRAKVAVDGHYDAFQADAVASIEDLDGTPGWGAEGVLIVRSGPARDRVTLVFGDAIMNQPHLPTFEGTVYRWMGCTGGPRVHSLWRWTGNKRLLRAHLERLAAIPGLTRIIPGHGDVIEHAAAETFAEIAAKL